MPRKHFDLLRNSHATVPLYADACALLVFAPFSSVCQRAEKFFDTQYRSVSEAEADRFFSKQAALQRKISAHGHIF